MKQVTKQDVIDTSEYLNLIVYGEPGTGKTVFGASGCLDPLTSPVLFVEYRAQIASLRSNPLFFEAMDNGNLIVVTLEKYSEIDYVYNWLLNGRGTIPAFDKIMDNYGHPADLMPKTVVFDSITEIQREEVMRTAGNTPNKFLATVSAPEIQDWGSILNQFTLLANLFFKLPYHVIFSGLEDVDYGKGSIGEAPPITGYRLALQGQSKRQFPAYALTLMRLERAPRNKDGVFNIGYTQTIQSKTKDQTGLIPDKIPNPTIPKLAKYLQR